MTRYIGKQPAVGNFVKLDAISVVNGQASYTMQSGSVNFTPESANHMLVSLNGVIQAPISSFTISGSTITFASALSTGDVINFIMVYGNVLDIGTPSDDTVSAAKLKTDSVIEAKIQDDAVTRDKINAISTSSLPSFEAKGTSGQTDGYIQLNCEQNSHGIKLKSPPHSAGQSYTLTFPSTAPANNKFLQTNSSGVLSFADAGGGKILQVVQGTFDTNASISSGFADTGITASITPASSSNKVLILCQVSATAANSGGSTIECYLRLLRGSTAISQNAAVSNRTNITLGVSASRGGDDSNSATIVFLDSPSTTSATTYKIQATDRDLGGGTAYINRSVSDDNLSTRARATSNIVLMEIAG